MKAGRYSTRDVHGWLKQCGFIDVSNMEATNIGYCLLQDIPVKGWKTPVPDEQGAIEDYPHNTDLALEVSSGGVKSITNLRIFHKGLSKQVDGYYYRLTTDSEDCFSGID